MTLVVTGCLLFSARWNMYDVFVRCAICQSTRHKVLFKTKRGLWFYDFTLNWRRTSLLLEITILCWYNSWLFYTRSNLKNIFYWFWRWYFSTQFTIYTYRIIYLELTTNDLLVSVAVIPLPSGDKRILLKKFFFRTLHFNVIRSCMYVLLFQLLTNSALLYIVEVYVYL